MSDAITKTESATAALVEKAKPRRLADYPAILATLFAEIEDADGEMTMEQAELLDVLEVAFQDKVEATWLFSRELEDRAAACEATAARYADRAAGMRKKAARLKTYIADAMAAANTPKIKGTYANVSLVRNSAPSIRWDGDAALMPPAFQTVKTTVSLNYQEAVKAWKEERLPDGFVVQVGTHLRGT